MLIEDRMMFKCGFLNNPANIQKLLELVYSDPSWLIKHEVEGKTFATFLHENCLHHEIEPLYMLALLQKESSGVRSRPKNMDFCLGYGCPEGGGKNEAYAGFGNQFKFALRSFSTTYRKHDPVKNWKNTPCFLYDKGYLEKNKNWIELPQKQKNNKTLLRPAYQPECIAEAMSFYYNPRLEGITNLSKIWKDYFAVAKANKLIVEMKDITGL